MQVSIRFPLVLWAGCPTAAASFNIHFPSFPLFQGMLACLQKTDNNQSMCSNEIKSFQACFEKFKAEDAKLQEIKELGIRPVGQRAKYGSTIHYSAESISP